MIYVYIESITFDSGCQSNCYINGANDKLPAKTSFVCVAKNKGGEGKDRRQREL